MITRKYSNATRNTLDFMRRIHFCFLGALLACVAVPPCATVAIGRTRCHGVVKKTSAKKTKIIVGFNGTSKQDADVLTLKKALDTEKVHGCILYARNIVNPTQLKSLISFLKKNAPQAIVSIDQEGGVVERLKTKDGFPCCGAMLAAADYKNIPQAIAYHRQAAKEMRSLGINWVLGPVADVNTHPDCPIIGKKKRSFSKNPIRVAQYCNAIINTYQQCGIKACLKHAPGHGSSMADSHLGFTDVTKTWHPRELEPFFRCAKKHPGVAIMMAHVFNETLDTEFPASMSEQIIQKINTGLMQRGAKVMPVYMADAYEMKAISNEYTPKEFLDRCKKIGMDWVFLFCQDTLNASRETAVYKKRAYSEGIFKR